MAIKYVQLENFDLAHKNFRYFATFDDDTYIFVVKWSDYCECAFLSIYDYNNNPIITGRALVNNLVIRNNKLPHTFFFVNKNGETYEPTLKNIAEEFVLAYED